MGFRFSVIGNNATYNLSSALTNVDEGLVATITLTTAGVQNYQPIPYVITGVDLTDFIGVPSLTGNFVVYNHVADLVLPLALDYDYENQETITITLTEHPSVTLDVDVNNIMPGVWWDSNTSAGAAVWDLGRSPWGASYWDV